MPNTMGAKGTMKGAPNRVAKANLRLYLHFFFCLQEKKHWQQTSNTTHPIQ